MKVSYCISRKIAHVRSYISSLSKRPSKIGGHQILPYLFALAVWIGLWWQESIQFRTFHSFSNNKHHFITNDHKNGRDSTTLPPSFPYDSL